MRGFWATYLRELLLLKERFLRVLLSFSINPFLYILAFGLGLGKEITISGHSYLEFLVPGLIAGSSMLQAFAINVEINVARFYLKVFEEFQSSPISPAGYVLGEVFSGITRAFISTFLILTIAKLLGDVRIDLNFLFFIVTFLNAFIFASLGVASAMTIKTHADQTLITNFVITPMMFLGGTFFPVDNLPEIIQPIIRFLPLTLVAETLRKISWGINIPYDNIVLLFFLSIISFVLAVYSVKRAQD